MKVWPSKDPDETLKFSYDFAPDLATGVTLDPAATTFEAMTGRDAGTIIADRQTLDTVFTAVIASGLDGQEAVYTLRVTATDGQVFEDTVALPIAATETLVPVYYVANDFTPPSPANVVALFPEFAKVPTGTIAYYLQRAARSVDTSWTSADFGHARILLAAHLMTLGGLGSSAEAAAVNDGSGQFKSMAIGSLRLDRFDVAKDAATFQSTRYGKEFRNLLRANRGGPRVTGRALPPGWGDGDKAWY